MENTARPEPGTAIILRPSRESKKPLQEFMLSLAGRIRKARKVQNEFLIETAQTAGSVAPGALSVPVRRGKKKYDITILAPAGVVFRLPKGRSYEHIRTAGDVEQCDAFAGGTWTDKTKRLYYTWKQVDSKGKGVTDSFHFLGRQGKRSDPMDLAYRDASLHKYLMLYKVLVASEKTAGGNTFRFFTEPYQELRDPVRNALIRNAPEFIVAYDNVIRGKTLYRDETFVSRGAAFNNYCSWLFETMKINDLALETCAGDDVLIPGFGMDDAVTILFNTYIRRMTDIGDLSVMDIRKCHMVDMAANHV